MGLCTGRVKTTNTTGSDFTCYDKDYNVTSVGITFKECVSCELQSATFDHATHQTDLGWALCRLNHTFPRAIAS